MWKLVICLIFCVPFALHAQVVTDSILVDGNFRSFHFNQPKKKLINGSLMFVMHGSGGSGRRIMKETAKLEAIAPGENLLIVYPDGYKNYWNECRRYAGSEANKLDIDEGAFFNAMISYFHDRYGISKNIVVAAGFSGGGHMAYKLGLTMPDKIRAIAAIVANMPDSSSIDCVAGNKALPVLIINGTNDNVNPWKGGEMFVNNSSYGVVLSSRNSFAYWARLAGYTGEPATKELPDKDPSDKKTIRSYFYAGESKPRIELLEINGGAHDYPNDIDVYVYAWEFFRTQVKEIRVSRVDPSKPVQIVDAACGQCKFGLAGKSCDLAVRINGKAYFVDGSSIDDHGDAHAKDGFCEAIRQARLQGELADDRFRVTYMELINTP